MAVTGFDHRVTWEDFTERDSRPAGETEDAFCKARFRESWGFASDGRNATINSVNVSIAMDSRESWVVTSAESDELLRHEQGHFDITALGARDVHRQLDGMSRRTERELRAAVAELKRNTQREIDRLNELYDDQTGHGSNRSAQVRWNNRILSATNDPNGTLASIEP
jgi:predicted secreted Zn-dependent protease